MQRAALRRKAMAAMAAMALGELQGLCPMTWGCVVDVGFMWMSTWMNKHESTPNGCEELGVELKYQMITIWEVYYRLY